MSAWQIAREALDDEAASAFATLEAVFALDGELIAVDPLSHVVRVEIGGRRYYVKRYTAAGKNLRRWIGRPRVKAEWQNLRRFAKWGIPTATVVGWGLERRLGAFERGAMITAELPRTEDLALLAFNRDSRLANRDWVAQASRQVAHITRTMHAHHFTHNDLKWRNLLVEHGREPRIYLIDCPAGEFWWGPLLAYRIVKDLACLDKVAKHHLSRTQRLRFYLDYAEKRRLDAGDKARVRRVVAFFAGRE